MPIRQGTLTEEDIVTTIEYLVRLQDEEMDGEAIIPVETEASMDHFGDRAAAHRRRADPEPVPAGPGARMEHVIPKKTATQERRGDHATLMNIRPVVASIKEFFGTSQLSQFMDQTNPLAGLTHKRRLSLGTSSLSTRRHRFRGARHAQRLRRFPVDAGRPEHRPHRFPVVLRPGSTSSGSSRTPYRKVKDGKVTAQIDYLTANKEDRHVIAQANAPLEGDGSFTENRVLVRREGSEVDYIPPDDVDYMDVSPRQMVSVATAMIPFLEHDDANRTLIG